MLEVTVEQIREMMKLDSQLSFDSMAPDRVLTCLVKMKAIDPEFDKLLWSLASLPRTIDYMKWHLSNEQRSPWIQLWLMCLQSTDFKYKVRSQKWYLNALVAEFEKDWDSDVGFEMIEVAEILVSQPKKDSFAAALEAMIPLWEFRWAIDRFCFGIQK